MKGDRDEDFRAFFEAEADRLRRLAVFLIGDVDRGADLAQEALIRLYRHWGRIRNDDPGPYARRILINLVRTAHRRSLLERRHSPPTAPEPDRPTDRIDDFEEVSSALAALSPIQRATIVLRFYEDMTEAEIGRVLDRPVGTVKSNLHRGLAKLRPLFEARRESA